MIEYNKTYRIGVYDYCCPETVVYLVPQYSELFSIVALDKEIWLKRCEYNKVDGVIYATELVPNIPIQYRSITNRVDSIFKYIGHNGKIIHMNVDLDLSQEYMWFVATCNNHPSAEYLVLLSEPQINDAIIRDIIE
jgi:hypothetical protein